MAEVFDTEQWETVYNVRVAEFHTYFVGEESWGWAAWAHNAYTYQVVPTNAGFAIQDITGRRYINTSQTALTPGKNKNANDVHNYTEAQADALANKLNEMLSGLVAVLTNLPGVTEQLTSAEVKLLFQNNGGLTGTLDFSGFFLGLVTAPSNIRKSGGQRGRPRVDWDLAEQALGKLIQKYGWEVPDRSEGDWQAHQREVTKLLRAQAAGTANRVGDQVELKITYNGQTVTTDADNLVLNPNDLSLGGQLIDAKFSDTYDLSKATPGTLRSKLTKNQRKVWDWILNAQQTDKCQNLKIELVGPGAMKLGLMPGQELPAAFVANLKLLLYVSNGAAGVNGILPITYS